MMSRLRELSLLDQVVIALSLLAFGFLLIDPFMLERAKALPPEVRKFFAAITNIGRSNWMLIPTGRGGRARARAHAAACELPELRRATA